MFVILLICLLPIRQGHSVYHGTESLFFRIKIWDTVPSDIKLSESLEVFKLKIKKWTPLSALGECTIQIFKMLVLFKYLLLM